MADDQFLNAPPRLAAWLLMQRLPSGDCHEVIGDLDEEFHEYVRARSLAWARRWYWRQALSLAWGLHAPSDVIDPSVIDLSGRSRMLSMDDVRFAVRRLVKQPAATIASILTLACAIGAAVAASSLLSAVLLYPLPVADADRLVVVGYRSASAPATGAAPAPLREALLYPVYPAVRASGIFAQVAAFGTGMTTRVTASGATGSRPTGFVSYDFFETIGVRLQAGRGFSPEDDRPGAAPVAILSDRFWRRVFNTSPDALSQRVVVNGNSVAIVGVAAPGFRGLNLSDAPDLYLPLHIVADVTSGTNWFANPGAQHESPTAWVHLVGRLKPGVDSASATAQFVTLPKGRGITGLVFALTPVNTAALAEGARPDMTRFARLLGLTVGLLLLIGCLTVGMLLLLRTEARRDEFAMCLALGATRGRLAMGIVLEGALLSTASAALALPVNWWLLAGVRAFQLPGGIDVDLLEIPFDGRLLFVAGAAAVTATIVIALVAGVFGFSADTAGALRARAGATPRIGRRRTRSGLIVAQVAVALVLLVGAGLFARSLSAALSLNPGYETGRIATADIGLRPYGYSPARSAAFFDELREQLIHSPAVRSVAFDHMPGGMGGGGSVLMDGESREVPSYLQFHEIDDRYFSTMGLSITSGRGFDSSDRDGSPRVGIVSQSLGRLLARGGNPIGHRIADMFGGQQSGTPGTPGMIEVVGVVPDIITSVTTLEPLKLYTPIAQTHDPLSYRTVVLRATGDPSPAVNDALAAVKRMEPAMAPPKFSTIDEGLGKQMSPQKFGATVLGALGGIAALLTLFGIYVLAESMSAMRRREMGVRAALGASSTQLSALVLVETTRLIAVGLGVGLLLVWFGTGVIRSFLFGVQPLDPTTLIGVATTMLVLAVGVSLRPALRAARVDLARVLREE